MAGGYGAKKYKNTSVLTASREQILILLYEAAIRNVKKASACIDKKDIAGKGMAIGKAHDIILELISSLNFEIGGDVARDLERLYNFMIEQLIKANIEGKKEPLETVEKIMMNLLDGWRGAIKEMKEGPKTGQGESNETPGTPQK